MLFRNKKNQLKPSAHQVKNSWHYHVFFINKNNSSTRSVRIHKTLPWGIVAISCIFLLMCLVFLFDNIYIRHSFRVLQNQHLSSAQLKTEIESLQKKINEVEKTLETVDTYSHEIKKVAKRADDRLSGFNYGEKFIKKSPPTTREVTDYTGIGPLTAEEFEYVSKKKSREPKAISPQLKELSDRIEGSKMDAQLKLEDFKNALQQEEKKLSKSKEIPDVSPVLRSLGRISSPYGWRPSPLTGKERMHFGLDIAAPLGSPIHASANGEVVKVSQTADYGRVVEVQHKSGLLTRYAHTNRIYVTVGQKIKKGDIIAEVGNTGHSTGPHVHYEIENHGKRQDPERYIMLW